MMTTYIIDLRDAAKPSQTTRTGSLAGGMARPHYSEDPRQRERRKAARIAGGVKRIVLHQWAAEVITDRRGMSHLSTAQERDEEEARRIAYRAAGLNLYGNYRAVGGAPYHVSVGVTSQGSGVVALVWPWQEHTFHAQTANAESVGVGLMGSFGRDDDGPRPEGLARALRIGLTIAGYMVRRSDVYQRIGLAGKVITHATTLDAGWSFADPVPLRTHSQTQRKPADPGLWAIVHGVSPLVQMGAVEVEPDYHEGKGQPWPESWRRALPPEEVIR